MLPRCSLGRALFLVTQLQCCTPRFDLYGHRRYNSYSSLATRLDGVCVVPFFACHFFFLDSFWTRSLVVEARAETFIFATFYCVVSSNRETMKEETEEETSNVMDNVADNVTDNVHNVTANE